MKSKKTLMIIPCLGTLVATLSGCNNTVYEYGSLKNLLYNHWNCGVFEEVPFESEAKFDSVHDKKEIVIKNLKKMKVSQVNSINASDEEFFTYSNSILHEGTNCHYNSVMTLWSNGFIKILATDPVTYNLSVTHLYQISEEDAQKINNQAKEWFTEVEKKEKEFLEFTTIDNLLKTASKENHGYNIVLYESGKDTYNEIKVDKEFPNKLTEAKFADLGYEGLDVEFSRKHLNHNHYDGDSILFNYSREKTDGKFGGYNISYIDLDIYDDGIVHFYLWGHDKADRVYSFQTFYSFDKDLAKEVIRSAIALK